MSETNTADWNATGNTPSGWRLRKQGGGHQEQDYRGMESQATKLFRNSKKVIGFRPIYKAHVHKSMTRIEEVDTSMTKKKPGRRQRKDQLKIF